MVKAECRKRFNELLRESNKGMRKSFERLFDCGGIEPKNYNNDYELPKIIFCASLKNAVFQYTPLSNDNKKVVKNLEHF